MKKVEEFNKTTNSKHAKIRDPRLKHVVQHTFNSLYPRCIELKYAEPSLTKMEIAQKFCGKINVSAKSFSNMMDHAGWYKVEKRFRSSAGEVATTEQIMQTLEKEKAKGSAKHLRKMISYIDDAHKTVECVVEENQKDRNKAAKTLGNHLNDLEKLERIGSKVFDLGSKNEGIASTVINLAILAKFDPTS